jgi:P-type Ca2+ transporter type 2C
MILATVAFTHGMPLTEIFLLVVALSVAVIPESIPVALTVALAIGMRKMSHRNVIVRILVAVELHMIALWMFKKSHRIR